LERLAGDLQGGRPVNTAHLGGILDFLRTYADKCHHGKEEDLLFPALNAIGLPTQGGPVGVMLYEHEIGREHIRAMGEALAGLEAGRATYDQFAIAAVGYVNLLRAHIEKENQILFTIAEQRLSPEEHARLAHAFAQLEAERMGLDAHERYHALVRELRDAYLCVPA
jgi:hemerythrin-like domain-containing protein